MANGHEIVFPTAVKDPDKFIRDCVTFVLQEEEHLVLQREGDDLIFKHTLSLNEALWAFEFVLTHLDNRELDAHLEKLLSKVKVINEEGMPIYQRPYMKGKLYIHFFVDISLPSELYKDLKSALPRRTSVLTDIELAK
ncbi:LOW QUALITY PROTEIN: dnaJ protein [Cinnamomum micranthum f. kanehirae]|uniref:DnaJ protein n=1 Tax=Cinnamomum micranthum f. kanehirae TaxID=337451 RepID=A0A3S3N6E3_9MAGN|nr:LOW QUALITY PROTEIN: dnaJ protein [Cinnamomum micranthum f. kanehirae]